MDWGRQDLSNPSNQNPDVRLFGDKMMEIGNLNDFLKLDECDSSKNTIVSHFTEIKQSIESCQVHISKSASILIEEIEKYEKRAQNSLNESKRLCLKILHEAVFPMSEKKGQYTEMLLNLPHSQIGPYLPTWEFSEPTIKLDSALRSLCDLMSVNSLKKTLENSAPKASENLADLECNLDKISSFKASTKNLLELNIKEKTQKLTTLDIPENMSDHTSICLLPDSSLFCYGSSHRVDRRHIYSGITFVITPNYDIKLLTSGQPCYKSGTIYYNGAVFAFGGDNGQPLNLAETYNFAHNLWKKIASLPETSEHCSCSLFKDEILILAQNSKVFSYNPLSNSYSKMIEFHKANIQQLCVANGKAYLLRSKTIHESEFEDASTWRNICNFSIPAGGSISYQIIDDNSIYFMRYYDVYRFDIRKKRVSCIFEHEKFVESDEDHKYKRYEEIYH